MSFQISFSIGCERTSCKSYFHITVSAWRCLPLSDQMKMSSRKNFSRHALRVVSNTACVFTMMKAAREWLKRYTRNNCKLLTFYTNKVMNLLLYLFSFWNNLSWTNQRWSWLTKQTKHINYYRRLFAGLVALSVWEMTSSVWHTKKTIRKFRCYIQIKISQAVNWNWNETSLANWKGDQIFFPWQNIELIKAISSEFSYGRYINP